MRACIATLVTLGAWGVVRADTVNLTYMGTGSGRLVHVVLGTQQWDTFAGRLIHHTSSGTGGLSSLPSSIVTFCADLLQTQTRTPAAYASSPVAMLSGNGGSTNLGYAKQAAIRDLYAAAAGRQLTLGLDYACAFQVAVWEVVYDYNASLPGHGLSETSGRFRATGPGGVALSASIRDKIRFLLSAVGAGARADGLMGLKSGPFQDQLYMNAAVVPIPAAAWMGLSGLGLAALVVRRKSRAG